MFRTLIQFLRLPFTGDRGNFYKLRMITGFSPGNMNLYKLALTHKSASITLPDGTTVDNERLEYLGDAVLDAIIADYLYRRFPVDNEGFLTQLRSKIVTRKQLNKLAFKIGISPLIITHTHQQQEKLNILGNALEAVVGAVYLDKGYYKTRKFVIRKMLDKHLDLNRLARKEFDFKSRIIEWAQKNKKEISFFSQESSSENKEHAFTTHVMLMDEVLGTGTGHSKKDAEQKAAEKALMKIIQ